MLFGRKEGSNEKHGEGKVTVDGNWNRPGPGMPLSALHQKPSYRAGHVARLCKYNVLTSLTETSILRAPSPSP